MSRPLFLCAAVLLLFPASPSVAEKKAPKRQPAGPPVTEAALRTILGESLKPIEDRVSALETKVARLGDHGSPSPGLDDKPACPDCLADKKCTDCAVLAAPPCCDEKKCSDCSGDNECPKCSESGEKSCRSEWVAIMLPQKKTVTCFEECIVKVTVDVPVEKPYKVLVKCCNHQGHCRCVCKWVTRYKTVIEKREVEKTVWVKREKEVIHEVKTQMAVEVCLNRRS